MKALGGLNTIPAPFLNALISFRPHNFKASNIPCLSLVYELNGFGIAVEINGAVAFVGRPRSRLLATLFVWDGKQAHVVCARACQVRRE